MTTQPEIEKLAFESKQPDRGYTCRASYLKPPNAGDALVEILKDGQPLRSFLFPAYKIWNIAAHFGDIVDGEIAESARGYEMAAWDGISGAVVILPAGRAAVEGSADETGEAKSGAGSASTEVCDGGRKTSELKQDANRHSQH